MNGDGEHKMTVEDFSDMLYWAEPDFEYHGERYSICHPNGRYYVFSSDRPEDEELEFDSIDEMLDHWIIQGKRLRDIVPEIEI